MSLRHLCSSVALMGLCLAAPSARADTLLGSTTYNGVTYRLYQASTATITWQAAQATAVALGGNLASVHSAAQNTALFAMIQPSDQSVYLQDPASNWQGPWLGAYRIATSGAATSQFAWIDGTTFDYANFASGEPNNNGGGEDRVQYFSNQGQPTTTPGDTRGSQWNDVGSAGTYSNSYVVELVASAVPEPAAWLSMLVGVGMLGAVMRRRPAGAARIAPAG